jgi:hypothetical protein
LLGIVLAADQLVQWTVLRDGVLLGRRIAPFDPPLFSSEQREKLATLLKYYRAGVKTDSLFDFDTELGWCAHPAPRSELPAGVRRIVAVGDSFTLGMEVRPEESWVALVDDARADLGISNLAVGGYGLDQTLLRLERDGFALHPDEVWLGWVPSTALRNVSIYVPADRHWAPSPAFKPRFVLDEAGALVLVPNPATDPERLAELLGSQSAFLAHAGRYDHFVQRSPKAWAPLGSSIWHRSALARLWLTISERGGRDGEPELADPGSEVARLCRALLRRAAEDCKKHDVRLCLVLLPDLTGLQDRARRGAAVWEPLLGELRAQGVGVIDCTDALQIALEREHGRLWAPGGHYNAAGNRSVAAELLRVLAR